MSALPAQDVLPEHTEAHFAGLTFHLGTMVGTGIAGLIVIGLGLYMRVRATQGVPSKLQLAWEGLVRTVERQVASSIGPPAPYVVPLAVTLFVFILIANWLEVIPTGGYVPAPTEDVALTLAMALFVMLWVYIDGMRRRGVAGYVKGFFRPYWWLAPFNAIEELAKPITLALRLWGNIFAGALMLALIALMPAYVFWLPQAAWRLFDLFIGVIQAFIFALLTILYFGMATSSEH